MLNMNPSKKLHSTPLRNRRFLWLWFVAASAFLILIIPILPQPYGGGQVLLTAVGGLWAWAFYLHGRHADDAKFMKELLTEFNTRYNKLNNDLQSALWSNEPFTVETKLKFIDYFNLCAEEWVFKELGYIYDPIWEAWHNGMCQYGNNKQVIALWKEQQNTDSYYGFRFPINDGKEIVKGIAK